MLHSASDTQTIGQGISNPVIASQPFHLAGDLEPLRSEAMD